MIYSSEAYRLIASYDRALPGSYDDAWNMLCARYDNPRRQVDNIITSLTSMDAIKNQRDHYFRMYTTTDGYH